MHFFRVATALIAGATVVAWTSASASASRARPAEWAPVALAGTLQAVAATSPGNAWAVGETISHHSTETDTLILHWDGVAWTRVPSPANGRLYGITAVSARNAWAVGDSYLGGHGSNTSLILHWNGASWTRVPSPTPTRSWAGLYGVAAISSRDAWAVGWTTVGLGLPNNFLLHWNGTKWRQASLPPLTAGLLSAVAASSRRAAWIVGNAAEVRYPEVTLHWNGTSWQKMTSPEPTAFQSSLNAVSASAAGGVWIVGSAGPALAARLDGTRWHLTPVPASAATATLNGVAAISARDAWADGAFASPAKPLLVHWNGTRWTRVPSPAPPYSSLNGITAVSPRDIWAVGQTDATSPTVVILHWNGTTWQRAAG